MGLLPRRLPELAVRGVPAAAAAIHLQAGGQHRRVQHPQPPAVEPLDEPDLTAARAVPLDGRPLITDTGWMPAGAPSG
jgi:hypothetical protein